MTRAPIGFVGFVLFAWAVALAGLATGSWLIGRPDPVSGGLAALALACALIAVAPLLSRRQR